MRPFFWRKAIARGDDLAPWLGYVVPVVGGVGFPGAIIPKEDGSLDVPKLKRLSQDRKRGQRLGRVGT
jgi:hypothetical protein